MVDENSGVVSVPADEGADPMKDFDKQLSNLPPASEGVITPAETVPKPVEKYVPYERFQEKVREVNSLKTRNIVGESPMEVVKLAKALEGRTPDEIDFITRNAKSGKIDDIIAASRDEMVQLAIEAKRKKIESQKKVPDPSSPEFANRELGWQDIKSKFGMDEKGKAEFRKYAEEQEKGKRRL
jgi:hypothetical protein